MSSLDSVLRLLEFQRMQEPGLVVGYTSGVFDFFHEGHSCYITACKRTCDFLLVGVDCDDRVKRRKGKERPFESQDVRVASVNEAGCIGFVKTSPSEVYINIFKPDVLYFSLSKSAGECLSSSAYNFSDAIQSYKIPYVDGVSTTLLVKGISN